MYAKDILDFLHTTCPEDVDSCGVVPGDVGFEPHEFCKVVYKLFLALAEDTEVLFYYSLSVWVVESAVQYLPKFFDVC